MIKEIKGFISLSDRAGHRHIKSITLTEEGMRILTFEMDHLLNNYGKADSNRPLGTVEIMGVPIHVAKA